MAASSVQAHYNAQKQTLAQMGQKLTQLESDADEHRLVIETLEPMEGDRKCFRMIGGVLVERTVNDVLPALKTNQSGIQTIMEGMAKEYRRKEEAFTAWQQEHNVRVVSQ